MQKIIKRGDIYYADLTHGIGSEQSGRRPVLIIQNDIGNKYSGTVIIAVITSKIESKAKLPTHFPIKAQQGLGRDSLVLLEQIRTVDKTRLLEYIGALDEDTMQRVGEGLAISMGIEKKEVPKDDMLVLNLCTRCEADFRNSGYFVIKRGWQEVKTDCDFCQINTGWSFGIFKSQ